MLGGNERVTQLDPTDFFDNISLFVKEHVNELGEVYIRRIISSLFLALFNFWGCKRKYVKKELGTKTNQDYYSFGMFIRELLENGYDAEIISLYLYRTAADHYIDNPTTIEIQDKWVSKKLSTKKTKVSLNKDSLKRSIEAAMDILDFLKER